MCPKSLFAFPMLNPQTKSWLENILKRYQNKEGTLVQTEEVLLKNRGLQPKTDYYTHDNGNRSLLLNLFGVLTIDYERKEYNIPVSLWIPLAYPLESPVVFITPTQEMIIKHGRYVDLSGRVLHPYMSFWNPNVSGCLTRIL